MLPALGDIAVVIPARLASSRVPRKALQDLAGLPLLEHVRRRAVAADVGPVYVATDSEQIALAIRAHGGQVLETGPAENGTQRVAQAAELLEAEWILNVQGDQPLVDPAHIRALAAITEEGITTLAGDWPEGIPAEHPARVKIAIQDGRAREFSRSPIPREPLLLHIGLYGYTRAMLRRVTSLPVGARARAEGLEQLTWLEAGLPIAVGRVGVSASAIDTLEQLETVRRSLQTS